MLYSTTCYRLHRFVTSNDTMMNWDGNGANILRRIAKVLLQKLLLDVENGDFKRKKFLVRVDI